MTEESAADIKRSFFWGMLSVVAINTGIGVWMSLAGSPLSAVGLTLFVLQFFYSIPFIVMLFFKSTRPASWGLLSMASISSIVSLGLCFGGLVNGPY